MALKKTSLLALLFLFTSIPTGWSQTSPSKESSEGKSHQIDSEERFMELAEQFKQFKRGASSYLIRLFEEKGRPIMALKTSQRKKKAEYLNLKKSVKFWGQVAKLKKDLVKNYLDHYPDTSLEEKEKMEREADGLAFNLIQGIERLQAEYKIHTFPLIHNFLIDIKLAKRGACKHWAEDLLKVVNSVEHPHFTSYWAEAHPGKMTEHNVAVLAPRGIPFDQGILIDPWRTAGKPYWDLVEKDNHPWQVWPGFVPR